MTNRPADGTGSPRKRGTMLALIKGRSGTEVLANSLRSLAHAPAFVASRLRRRDPRTWVFGNLHGFRDSPRYLAEHVVHSRPELSAYWIAHSDKEAEAAAAAGLKVARSGSAEATRLMRRAGVAFFTHGFRDLDLAQLWGSYLVYLWHGTPLKRVALDLNAAQAKRRPLPVRLAARVVRWLNYRAYRLVSLFVAAGDLDAVRFVSAFGTSPDKVKVLGSPRFDVIRGAAEYERAGGADMRARLGYQPADRIVLWAPTHRREYGDAAWVPSLTVADLDAALAGTNIKLLVKAHPNADWDVYEERLPHDHRVRLLREADADVNVLLQLASALITDYSSVAFDHAILGRPIYFLAPDVEAYEAGRGMYDPYERMAGGRQHADWPSLLQTLRDDIAAQPDGEGMTLSRRVADYCRNNTAPNACARVTAAIIEATDRRARGRG